MTYRLFVLDVPENTSIVDVARAHEDVTLERVGPYYVIAAEDAVSVDRRATGARHAVWYSWVAGLDGFRIEQWDQDALRLVSR